MGTRILHMSMDVRGMLRNWTDVDLVSCFTDTDGNTLTPDRVRGVLQDELARGHEVIPYGEPCEGFDYSGGGCPGHPIESEADLEKALL